MCMLRQTDGGAKWRRMVEHGGANWFHQGASSVNASPVAAVRFDFIQGFKMPTLIRLLLISRFIASCSSAAVSSSLMP